MTTTDVPTFTGDELEWKPVDDGKTSDAIEVDDSAKEPVVEVVKEEDVDFGNGEDEANFEKIKASEDEATIHNLQPRKDLLVPGAVEASEAEHPPPIHKARATSGEKKRSKSRSNRARSVRVQEPAPTAPRRSASRPPAKNRGRSGGPIRPLQDRSPIRPLSPKSRKGPREIVEALSITPSLSSSISKAALLKELVEDYPIDGWALINLHVSAYYHEPSLRYPLTHPKQLAATAIRRDATLNNRWLCWACQKPNKMEPHKTGKTSFKTSTEVSYHWWNNHSTAAHWDFIHKAEALKVTRADILFAYGISLNDQPWPVGTALDELPVFIPSRSWPHDERLFRHPYHRRVCDTSFASEVGLPWNMTDIEEWRGGYPQYPQRNQRSARPTSPPPSRASPSPEVEIVNVQKMRFNEEKCKEAKDRGLPIFPGADNTDVAEVTSLGWLDPLDVFYEPLKPEIEMICAGATSVPDYGSSRKAWHIHNFGDSTLALELLRLEEHSFYILVFKMAATKAALSPTLFSSSQRQLSLTGSGWCSHTMETLLHCFLEAEKVSRTLSSNAFFSDVIAYIRECCKVSIPLYCQDAPRAPGREGKMTKKQQAALLV